MVYWRIELEDGRTGYQVMDDNLSNAQVVDDNGTPFNEPVVYSTIDTNPPTPAWANA